MLIHEALAGETVVEVGARGDGPLEVHCASGLVVVLDKREGEWVLVSRQVVVMVPGVIAAAQRGM